MFNNLCMYIYSTLFSSKENFNILFYSFSYWFSQNIVVLLIFKVDLNMQILSFTFQMLVQKLFNKFIVESLTLSSLSLMHSPPGTQNISEINLSPMEISTYRIRLRWTWLSHLDWESLAFIPFLVWRAIKKHIILASGYCEKINSVILWFFFSFTTTVRKKKKSHAIGQVSFFLNFLPWTTTISMNWCNKWRNI